MYWGKEHFFVEAYLLFQGCSKLPTIHYLGESAVCSNHINWSTIVTVITVVTKARIVTDV